MGRLRTSVPVFPARFSLLRALPPGTVLHEARPLLHARPDLLPAADAWTDGFVVLDPLSQVAFVPEAALRAAERALLQSGDVAYSLLQPTLARLAAGARGSRPVLLDAADTRLLCCVDVAGEAHARGDALLPPLLLRHGLVAQGTDVLSGAPAAVAVVSARLDDLRRALRDLSALTAASAQLADDAVALLTRLAACAFSPANAAHAALLRHLLRCADPALPPGDVRAASVTDGPWERRLGFQGRNAATDFRAAGVLGLCALAYLAYAQPELFRRRAPLSGGTGDSQFPLATSVMAVTGALLPGVREAFRLLLAREALLRLWLGARPGQQPCVPAHGLDVGALLAECQSAPFDPAETPRLADSAPQTGGPEPAPALDDALRPHAERLLRLLGAQPDALDDTRECREARERYRAVAARVPLTVLPLVRAAGDERGVPVDGARFLRADGSSSAPGTESAAASPLPLALFGDLLCGVLLAIDRRWEREGLSYFAFNGVLEGTVERVQAVVARRLGAVPPQRVTLDLVLGELLAA